MVRNTSYVHVKHSLQCALSVRGRFTLSFYIYIQVYLCHAGRAYLIYWEEEDSVSVTRRDNRVCEPAGGDVVKIKFQCQVCKGMVAEVGTPEAITKMCSQGHGGATEVYTCISTCISTCMFVRYYMHAECVYSCMFVRDQFCA